MSWSQFQNGGRHTGYQGQSTSPTNEPNVLWSIEPDDVARGGLIATERHLVRRTSKGLTAYEKTTGDQAWTTADTIVDDYFLNCDPVVTDRLIVFAGINRRTSKCEVRALVAETGEHAWSIRITEEDEYFHGLTASGNSLYLLRRNNDTNKLQLTAILLSQRAIRWTYEIDEFDHVNRPVAANEDLVVYSGYDDQQETGGVVAVNAETGQQRWFTEIGGSQMPPTIYEDTVFATPGIANSSKYAVVALETDDGAIRWGFESRDGPYASPAIAKGRLFFPVDDVVYAVDADDGTPIWKQKLGRYVENKSPVVVDDQVLLGDLDFEHERSYLNALSVESGDLNWEHEVKEGSVTAVIGVDDALFLAGRTYHGEDSLTIRALM